ncbi:hypothetical protein Hanom_Chr07g00659751 [Helianthus anomalus]
MADRRAAEMELDARLLETVLLLNGSFLICFMIKKCLLLFRCLWLLVLCVTVTMFFSEYFVGIGAVRHC